MNVCLHFILLLKNLNEVKSALCFEDIFNYRAPFVFSKGHIG